ncbi:hypothetical protein T484DRAFT_1783404 [Baffinella frigidus]|nr:hypothetical protein T484DRAFT_1783404 [Cryptophyta sp. CCMP2293]
MRAESNAATGLQLKFDARSPSGTKLISALTHTFSVVHDASPLSTLVLQVAPPSQIVAGEIFSFDVSILDQYGNPHDIAWGMSVSTTDGRALYGPVDIATNRSYNTFLLNVTLSGAVGLNVTSMLGLSPLIVPILVIPAPNAIISWVTLPGVRAVAQNRLSLPLPSVELLDRFGNKAIGGAEAGVTIRALDTGAGDVTFDVAFERWGQQILAVTCCGRTGLNETLLSPQATIVAPEIRIESVEVKLVYGSAGASSDVATFDAGAVATATFDGGAVATDAPDIPAGTTLETLFYVPPHA